jgi:hypothetical protein
MRKLFRLDPTPSPACHVLFVKDGWEQCFSHIVGLAAQPASSVAVLNLHVTFASVRP